ncbi:MAG: capsule biosynthesis protein, partial [Pseudomonadota bacterium]
VERFSRHGPQIDLCKVCKQAGSDAFSPLGLKVHQMSSMLSKPEIEAALSEAKMNADDVIRTQSAEGTDEHGLAGALRFFGRSILPDSRMKRSILARYLASARLSERAAGRLLRDPPFDAVVAHHGIYTPQGPIANVTRAVGSRLITWHPSYRCGRLIFEHGDTYHRAMISEDPNRWRNRELSTAQQQELVSYLESRTTGSQDWITFQRRHPEHREQLERSLGLSFDKPTFLLLGNVAWDARLHYEKSAYGEMTEWARDTVSWFKRRPDLQLIVRCHPGEVMSNPRAQDRLDHFILEMLAGELPPNIKVLAPEEHINTYALAAHAKVALIYNTKMGVELSARGMPVIVAGDAWIRGKGISHDASSPDDYIRHLENADRMTPLSDDQIRIAQRYAYHFFFRRCIPVDAFSANQGWPLCALSREAFTRAQPGVDSGLDVICDGIMSRALFEYE